MRPEVLTMVAAAFANVEVLVGLEKALEQQLEEEAALRRPNSTTGTAPTGRGDPAGRHRSWMRRPASA